MPKMKTNKAAAARFKLKKSGKIKRNKQHTTHILTKMSNSRKRRLKKDTIVHANQQKTIKQLIQKAGN